jgi:hypothetical protein
MLDRSQHFLVLLAGMQLLAHCAIRVRPRFYVVIITACSLPNIRSDSTGADVGLLNQEALLCVFGVCKRKGKEKGKTKHSFFLRSRGRGVFFVFLQGY